MLHGGMESTGATGGRAVDLRKASRIGPSSEEVFKEIREMVEKKVKANAKIVLLNSFGDISISWVGGIIDNNYGGCYKNDNNPKLER